MISFTRPNPKGHSLDKILAAIPEDTTIFKVENEGDHIRFYAYKIPKDEDFDLIVSILNSDSIDVDTSNVIILNENVVIRG